MSKGTYRQEQRRIARKALNRSTDPNPRVAHSYGGAVVVGLDKDEA